MKSGRACEFLSLMSLIHLSESVTEGFAPQSSLVTMLFSDLY
jgi:hypothetical protein